jgi:hypothetical protein
MALGDGIRRDVATISQAERDLLLDAFLKLDTAKFYPDGVSFWDKQEDIHKNAHFAGLDVHSGPAFIPWHRVLVNRLEALLRQVHPELSLHYWDWTTDPTSTAGGRANLFTPQFMGGTGDPVGPPFQNFESTEKTDPFGDGIHDHIWRQVQAGAPGLASDNTILAATTFTGFNAALQSAHNGAHGFIGGSIGDAHFSFHDPFVFLLHSNMDRLWAMWQAAVAARFDPATAYGSAVISPTEHVEPWAGGTGLEPWASDPTVRAVITYYDPSVLAPPCYDTLPTVVVVDQIVNPGSVINFNDVPVGETAARAAVFKVFACDDVTFQVKTGPNAPYTVLTPGGAVTAEHQLLPYVEARIWFGFTGGVANTSAPVGQVTIHCVENNQDYVFTLQANTIPRQTVAVMLALDQSGSMDDPAGTLGAKRIDVLREAGSQFVEVVQPNNGVGVVRFDTTAYPVADPTYPGLAVTQIGPGGIFDANRIQVRTAVQNHKTNPAGATSIGAGVQLARNTLSPVAGYDQKAIIVFTDGLENTAPMIADVMGSIDSRTFAIGLGTESQVSTAALNALTNGTGGYLLLTGLLGTSPDDTFLLTKYFLQILAGVTNTNIVLDPSGYIAPGVTLRVPFALNEADIDGTVILLTKMPAVKMQIETPDGAHFINPANVVGLGAEFGTGTDLEYYRFTLPVALGGGAHAGIWHALLRVDEKVFKRQLAKLKNDRAARARAEAHGVQYSLNVHSYSNLRMRARLDQTSLQPGATLSVGAVLTEYGIPVDHRAMVSAELRRPDNTVVTLALNETDPGGFRVSTLAPMAGIYRFRVMASGLTIRGASFTREQLLTGAVFQGGDNPLPTGETDSAKRHHLCQLLECLARPNLLGRFLAEHHVDPEALARCLRAFCRDADMKAVEVHALRPLAESTKRAKTPVKKKRGLRM